MMRWPSVIFLGIMCGALAAARAQDPNNKSRLDEAAASEEKDLYLTIPPSKETGKTIRTENEIPKKFGSEYFDARPKSFLVDPQGLLSRVDYRDRLSFLNYHADDSSIDLFVYVFKGNQEIPEEGMEEELLERFFKQGRPAAVIFYYMGKPQRAVLQLSLALTNVVPSAEQKRAMESAVIQASKDEDPSRQLEGFLVQMSIRIYWMEKMLVSGTVVGEEQSGIRAAVGAQEHKPTAIEKLQPLINEFKGFIIPAAAAGALLLVLIMIVWAKRRSLYRFPELDVEPRLGGSHAAGVGAVISFVSASIPPASQRDQVPDYLHRT